MAGRISMAPPRDSLSRTPEVEMIQSTAAVGARIAWRGSACHTRDVAAGHWLIEPGAPEVANHVHHHHEAWTVIEGCLKAYVRGVTRVLQPGDAVLVPAGRQHAIEAHGDCSALVVDWRPVPNPPRYERHLTLHGRDSLPSPAAIAAFYRWCALAFTDDRNRPRVGLTRVIATKDDRLVFPVTAPPLD
ncbi:MAG: cupin domain-containing protein, partial [Myxococcota bacterium]